MVLRHHETVPRTFEPLILESDRFGLALSVVSMPDQDFSEYQLGS